MSRLRKNRIEGGFDGTATQAKVESPGQFSGVLEEKVPAPSSAMEIEHGSGPMGPRRIGKKFLHIKKALRKRYDRGRSR
ncbi:MAG TPA: hypothetical protein DDW94_02525 [Deltaproteobacteria bacterium]|nr:MAG: hypothetical protein A2Z79_09315 [Deltaproteobacteria bacterium GWA2_55_82]OGQ64731.1 MAG: hypothetical protein A3I81_07735 [Deltaproteobacteria bacterium RIFCSPLOWO2_02_FULL_55_12]OIJ73760.1 MAG: hypothetical protein A2V21_305455 [Deltaproteobacteria bacterium GWC2_55_46]HBG45842.1 hypothetical protein [Deltaproteobacteria bacterium]HCY09739.1 hypothetical protein [Deltaproteobacteria bacterium]